MPQADTIGGMEIKLHNHFNIPAEDWNNLLAQSITHVPFLRHEYLSVWWQTQGGGEWTAHNLNFGYFLAGKMAKW